MPNCLICRSDYEPFISFGAMPIANGFLSPDAFEREYFFELKVGFCPACYMVQLVEQPDRGKMFHENYAFFSSTSRGMAVHFKEFADHVIADHLSASDPFVVEIGSNDGILLRHFAQAGVRHLGIEPSASVARVAIDAGVHTVSRFFDEELAREIVAESGQADAILAANVMCHIPYLHAVAQGVKILLKPDGLLMFEDPYLGDIVRQISYDQIYDEHAFYFSATSVGHLFSLHGLQLVDVIPQSVHGGSLRYVIAHEGARKVDPAVAAQRARELSLGLNKQETYNRLRRNIESSRNDLMTLLRDLRAKGKRIVGYAATSKSTTVINYCGITPDIVEYISDTTPLKQGRYSPGAHIPVRPHEEFTSSYPDYALLFGWNHAQEIFSKEQGFAKAGGKWITYVPHVKVSE